MTTIHLAGDSTVAPGPLDGSGVIGWGGVFAEFVAEPVANRAVGGATTNSFQAEGRWTATLDALEPEDFVLIQFGHNDQPGKAERSTDLTTEFPVNIARYVDEVKNLDGVPVLVTPLTRRTFRNGVLHNDLIPWADVTRRIAREKNIALIDLNRSSAAAVAKMGTTEADTLAEEPPPAFPAYAVATTGDVATTGPATVAKSRFDYTHLGAKGAALFSTMVARELVEVLPAFAALLRGDFAVQRQQ